MSHYLAPYNPNYASKEALTVEGLISLLQQQDPKAQIRIAMIEGDDILTLRGVDHDDVGSEVDPFPVVTLSAEYYFSGGGEEDGDLDDGVITNWSKKDPGPSTLDPNDSRLK